MEFFADLSIRKKLNLVIMLTSSVALILACTVFLAYDRYSYRQALRLRLESLANIIASSAEMPFAQGDAEETTAILRILESQQDIIHGAIIRPDGTIFAAYQRGKEPLVMPDQEDAFLLGDGQISLFPPIPMHEDEGTIFLEADLAEQQKREDRFTLIVLLILAGSFFVVYIVSVRRPEDHLRPNPPTDRRCGSRDPEPGLLCPSGKNNRR